MDFDLTPQEQAFADDVEKWLVENHDPAVMDPTRENFAQLADTPERRAFMKKLAAKGWLGMTWPREYGGQEIEGIYEFILNEALSRHGAPQIGKGVGRRLAASWERAPAAAQQPSLSGSPCPAPTQAPHRADIANRPASCALQCAMCHRGFDLSCEAALPPSGP